MSSHTLSDDFLGPTQIGTSHELQWALMSVSSHILSLDFFSPTQIGTFNDLQWACISVSSPVFLLNTFTTPIGTVNFSHRTLAFMSMKLLPLYYLST